MCNEEIVFDVLKDYKNNQNSILLNEKSKVEVLKQLCDDYKDFDIEDKYALCMYYLFYSTHYEDMDEEDIKEIFVKKSLPKDLGEVLGKIDAFRWIPTAFSKVLQLSSEIFEEAKKAYFDGDVSYEKVEEKLNRIIQLKTDIENDEYKYRDRDEILIEYEEVLSECILDTDTVKGERLVQSMRLGKYIDDYNPFSMPDDFLEE